MTDLTASGSRIQRDQLTARIDVLDKVGVLRTLPDDMHVTTEMVAEFYGVGRDTITQLVTRNRDELDDDGYRVVTRGAFEGTYNLSVTSSASRIALFPRRAVLRVGMLLRDSDVARTVRTYLLDTEQVAASRALTPAEQMAHGLIAAQQLLAERDERIAELEPKAELADNYLIAEGGARLVREVAKTLGMKQIELRRFLLEEKLIFPKHAPCGDIQYDHYAAYAHHFQMRETVVNHTWGVCSHYTLHILPRGVELIRKRQQDNTTNIVKAAS